MSSTPGTVLTQDESGSRFFHRVLRETADAFPRTFTDAPVPKAGKRFKQSYGDVLARFEAARVASAQRLDIARYLHRATAAALSFSRDGRTQLLHESLSEEAAPPRTVARAAEGTPGLTPEIPLDGRVYRGREVLSAIDTLLAAHHLTRAAADGLRWVVQHAESHGGVIDLQGQRFALLGASAELSVAPLLLAAGATVRWIDAKPAPVSATPGTVISTEGGDDLLTRPHEAAAALREFAADGPVHVGLFAYAPGRSRELLLAGVMDALVRSLGPRVVKSVAMYISPTSPVEVQAEDLTASAQLRDAPKLWQRTASLARALHGPGDFGGIARSVISLQGAAYQAAQYLCKRITAEVLAADGLGDAPLTVSANVAGITNTKSLSHPLFQVAFQGAPSFGVRIFEPATTRAVSGLLLLHDLLNPAAPGSSGVPHESPLARVKAVHSQQIHGAVYALPWQFEACVRTAAVVGLTKNPLILLKR